MIGQKKSSTADVRDKGLLQACVVLLSWDLSVLTSRAKPGGSTRSSEGCAIGTTHQQCPHRVVRSLPLTRGTALSETNWHSTATAAAVRATTHLRRSEYWAGGAINRRRSFTAGWNTVSPAGYPPGYWRRKWCVRKVSLVPLVRSCGRAGRQSRSARQVFELRRKRIGTWQSAFVECPGNW